ncbi:MAG: extracellular solute-binding protein [Deltaproteobacteria bacterium]|nr:extracellular solute-binding protein [Deltaproteobacteria bacterium]
MKDHRKKGFYSMTRRDFMKAAGVLGGAAMLGIHPLQALIAEAAVEPMDDATLAEQEKLYAAAKKEGEVTLYQSSSTQAGHALAKAFMKKYPDIKCNVYRGGSVKCHTKYDTERRAGKSICDVLHTSLYPVFLKMANEGLFMSYASPQAKYFREDWTDPEHFAPVRFTTMAIAWNTDLVKDDEAPKTWAESAEIAKEKRWFGKISIGDPHAGGTSLTQLYSCVQKWGDTAWEWWRLWGEADAGTFASHGAMDKEMMAGKYPLSLEQLDYRICKSKAKKTPVNAHWPEEGVAVAPGPAGIVKDAPHPNAAKLLYNYFLSSEGCQAFQKGGYSNTGRKTGMIKWKYLPDPEKLNIIQIDYLQMEKDMKPLLEKFDRVFGEAKKKARARK